MSAIVTDDNGDATLAAKRLLMEAIFRHAVFCPTSKTPYNDVVKIGMASAARRAVMKMVLRDTVLCAAVETPDYHLIMGHSDPL